MKAFGARQSRAKEAPRQGRNSGRPITVEEGGGADWNDLALGVVASGDTISLTSDEVTVTADSEGEFCLGLSLAESGS
ncbi:hypothetical protein E2C01_041311 [Portunus trituberculatus]|uniref:Uncharacterized protein n=1 Tax=Portunus trituberculatus TaxID=210409 RepID=A0A5B7FJQ1_PORTR|nr:hypothetical protein [Portunus trituberculatus]